MRLHKAAVASCEGVSLGAVAVFAAAGFLTTAVFLVGAFLLVAGFLTALAGAALLVAFTAARYYTPSGVSIQAKGIVPDIAVEQAKLEPLKPNANFSEENLPGHLINDQSKDDDAAAPTPANDNKKDAKKDLKKDDKKDGKDAKKDKDGASDYQLSRALDLIRAVSIYKKVGGDAPLTNADAPVPAATPTAPATKK